VNHALGHPSSPDPDVISWCVFRHGDSGRQCSDDRVLASSNRQAWRRPALVVFQVDACAVVDEQSHHV